MLLSLWLALGIISAISILADTGQNAHVPAVNIRHETVGQHGGNSIHRMIVSARAPGGFSLFGIVMSYDNRIIIPVDRSTHADIIQPTNTTVQTITNAPFTLLAGYGFIATPDAWVVHGVRTGFSFDAFTIGQAATPGTLVDVFAFYYRAVGDVTATTFRVEDGRSNDSMVGTHAQTTFVRSGVKILSASTTYIWGPNTPDHNHTQIDDGNIVVSEAPHPTPTPTATPPPHTPHRLTFRKTNQRLYEQPNRIIVPLPGTATFVLERQTGAVWAHVDTMSNDANGWVSFTQDLTASANYRIRKIAAPSGWILPAGHWQFATNDLAHIVGIPVSHGGNPAFIGHPPGHTGLHVGAMPLIPTPGPTHIPSPTPSPTSTPTPSPSPSPSASPSPTPTRSPSPTPTRSPSPTPVTTSPPGPGHNNPQTNPIRINLMIFGSVMALGLAAFGIASIAKKQTLANEAYRTNAARYDREKRLSDFLDDDKTK